MYATCSPFTNSGASPGKKVRMDHNYYRRLYGYEDCNAKLLKIPPSHGRIDHFSRIIDPFGSPMKTASLVRGQT